RNFLLKFRELPSGPLEGYEQLEQLRILENGYKIKVVIVSRDSISIDTISDISKLKEQGHG
ncbi:MAG TPA: 3-deoxy-manno-octulosonate cytidylyltransferase, partial [bacterium]|nr:3-deoxy-manno-octulosonate cytidylyltransferase [bacterium]